MRLRNTVHFVVPATNKSKLNLHWTYQEFLSHLGGESVGTIPQGPVREIVYDSRKIISAPGLVFFALNGAFRNGQSFLADAYDKGVRIFVVERLPAYMWEDASFILVENSLKALQKLAASHRKGIHYPIVAITGSLGKTTVKEWMYHLLSGKLQVYRSPKSYNSQLGVALSILQLPKVADLGIIEVAVTHPGEMAAMREMLAPDAGVLTNILPSHAREFTSIHAYANELTSLFSDCHWVLTSCVEQGLIQVKNLAILPNELAEFEEEIQFTDENNHQNARLAIHAASRFLSVDKERVKSLPHLAMRLETYEGINGSLIINDTYTMDVEAFKSSLSYQLAIANGRKRITLIGLEPEQAGLTSKLNELCQEFGVQEIHFCQKDEELTVDISHALVLVKGERFMQRIANRLKLKQHKTQLNYDLSALKHNLNQYKSSLRPMTKMLVMVKAQSYGAGLTTLASYLEKQGVDYFGVAYADEGVELRKAGIKTPILVMNTEEEGMESCVEFQLEPAIYDFEQLDELLKTLIAQEKTAYPIHIKLDTGMKRLGFHPSEVQQLMEIISAQPEVRVKSVYSHLADADNPSSDFTLKQIQLFETLSNQIAQSLSYPFMKHILNSEGMANYPSAQFDMVRLGIGLFGLSSNASFQKRLKPVIEWTSSISQIKQIQKGESIGYGQTFVAPRDMKIATIPIGYADGFKRSLSNGKGCVFIENVACPVLGRVCMDMIMVDLGARNVNVKSKVEIIGENQTLSDFARSCDTIGYEILTSISPRVHRSYSEEE